MTPPYYHHYDDSAPAEITMSHHSSHDDDLSCSIVIMIRSDDNYHNPPVSTTSLSSPEEEEEEERQHPHELRNQNYQQQKRRNSQTQNQPQKNPKQKEEQQQPPQPEHQEQKHPHQNLQRLSQCQTPRQRQPHYDPHQKQQQQQKLDFRCISRKSISNFLAKRSSSTSLLFGHYPNMNHHYHHYRSHSHHRLLCFLLSSFFVCVLCRSEAAFASSSPSSRKLMMDPHHNNHHNMVLPQEHHHHHHGIRHQRPSKTSWHMISRSFVTSTRGGSLSSRQQQQQQQQQQPPSPPPSHESHVVMSSYNKKLFDTDGNHNNSSGESSSNLPRTDITCVMQQPRVNGYHTNRVNGYNNNVNMKNINSKVYRTNDNNGNNNNNNNNNNILDIASSIGTHDDGTTDHDDEKQFNRKQRRQSLPKKTSQQHVEFVAETQLPTDLGLFQLRAYRVIDKNNNNPHNALFSSNMSNQYEPCVLYYHDKPPSNAASQPIPVRIHDQCLTSEVFGSRRCDCKEQLNMALKYIKEHGGMIIYLQQEGRGIGLANKIAAYSLQDQGFDTVDANVHLGFPDDAREYYVVPQILHDMNVHHIQLMTNNPRKTKMLQELGISIESTIPMVIPQMNPYNQKYMKTKISRMDHMNMADLLLADPNSNIMTPPSSSSSKLSLASIAERLAIANGRMAPRKTSIENIPQGGSQQQQQLQQEIGEDETISILERTVNGVQDNNTDSDHSFVMPREDNEPLIGIQAREDGYCLGKQSVIDAIYAIKRGELIVVVDDLDRENEGDFIMAASRCTPESMAQIIRYSSGVVCIAMEHERLEQLKLPSMIEHNEDPKNTAFTISVDATKEHGITTGISAKDRAITAQLLANPQSLPTDFHRPGHIFPLRAVKGGVLQRNGHTEAAIDFCKLANHMEMNGADSDIIEPAGLLCEIVSEENPIEMMRLPEIIRFCRRHNYVLTSIADLIQYRKDMEKQ